MIDDINIKSNPFIVYTTVQYRRERHNEKGNKIYDTVKKVNFPSVFSSAAEVTMKQQNSKTRYSRGVTGEL